MSKIYSRLNGNVITGLMAGMLLLPAVFIFALAPSVVEGQTATPDATTRFTSAFADLARLTGQQITSKDQAKAFCNQERYMADCADIGKRHGLYKAEQIKQVDLVLAEIKGQVVDELKRCTDAACLVDVAQGLAQRLAQKDPELARAVDLTPQKVQEKRIIVEAAKEIGVDAFACYEMDPETAAIDLLRACARLARHERVQQYLPEEAKRAAEFADASTNLDQSLQRGEFQCGNNTAEGCGNFCLNSSAETRKAGTSAIPAVCRSIATRFFGPEGEKHLENAFSQVQQTAEFYDKKAEKVTFTTLDGRTLNDPLQIGRYLEEEGKRGNVEAVGKGLDFMVARGFAKPQDKEFALKMVQKAKEKGGLPDFEACRQNVDLCKDFIPDEHRQEFEGFKEFEAVLRQELGFDPKECERGGTDESIGTRCFEASKRALPKIEAVARRFPQIQHVIVDIRLHVARGEEFASRKDQFHQEFQTQGGPGGCRSEQECRTYCSDPAHGPECIAFGAKNQISGFRGEEAIERFQEFNQVIQGPRQEVPPDFSGRFPGQGPFPGFQPPGQGGLPPGQIPGFSEPGRGFQPPPGFGHGPGGFGGPAGPSPECFAAIQSGDFLKAKQSCEVRFSGPVPPPIERPVCRPVAFAQCGEGQYRPESHDANNCPVFGECVPVPGYDPNRRTICPALPTVDSCPAGQEKVVNFSSPECGTYYGCKPVGVYPTPTGTGQPPYPTYSPYPTGSPQPGTSPYPTYSPPTGQREQIWNSFGLRSSIRSDADPARIAELKNVCANVKSGANIWRPGSGDYASPDFGIPDAEKCRKAGVCLDSQYFDGTACVASGPGTSPYPIYSPYPTYSPGVSPTPTPVGYKAQCADGIDNDNDGKIDYPADASCYDATDNDEFYPSSSASPTPTTTVSPYPSGTPYPTGTPASAPQCSDGRDNDGDGAIDYPADTGCYGRDDDSEAYVSTTSPTPTPTGYKAQCADGIDNDHDGKTDYPADSSCYDATDNDEYYPVTSASPTPTPGSTPSCSDGIDNDADGAIDYPADTGCYSAADTDEVYYPISSPTPIASSPTPSPAPGSCPSDVAALLGSGCHDMVEGYFNGAMTQYVRHGSTTVYNCEVNYVSGCSAGGTAASPTPYPTSTVSPSPTYSPTATYSPAPTTTTSPYPAYSPMETHSPSPVSFLRYSCPRGHSFDGRYCVVKTRTSFFASILESIKQGAGTIARVFGGR